MSPNPHSSDEGEFRSPVAEESRQRLLDAGARLLRRQFQAPGPGTWRDHLSFLTPQSVAEEAGYRSRAMLYRLWADEDPDRTDGLAFDRYLADLVVRYATAEPNFEPVTASWVSLIEAGVTHQQAANFAGSLQWKRMFEDSTAVGFITHIQLALALRGSPLQANYTERFEDRIRVLAEAYRFAGEVTARRPRPPLTWDQLGRMIWIIGYGFAIRGRLNPEAGERVPSPFAELVPMVRLNRFQIAIRAILESLTVPAHEEEVAP